jgi:hemerythrin-like domain-containing protein
MGQPLATLRDDHRNYSDLLALLKSDIDKLQHSEDPDFIRLYDIMNYMTNYPDISHHPVEEIMFVALEQKTPDAIDLIHSLTEEHKELSRLGVSLKEKLNYVTSGSIVSRSDIITAAKDYYQLFIEHINTEEVQLFPIIENTFTAEDWSLVSAQIDAVEDPLFGEVVHDQFTDLYERITLSKNEAT